jgi:sterol desaturase/sphingolipid hydroxylase (fatty acid hydroxylase superfamily)
MDRYLDLACQATVDTWRFLVDEVTHPRWHSYVWWLIGLSLLAWLAELLVPWRRAQPRVRDGFWTDGIYLFWSYFGFALLGYAALSTIAVDLWSQLLGQLGIESLVVIELGTWPAWAQLLTMFVVADFVQWNIHRLLHRVPWLWTFHQVHHSTRQMGFAAHLRFHWMETIVYKTLQYVPLAMLGFGLQDFFVVHIVGTAIGHLNHSNLRLTYGPLRYVLNNPVMHVWHHARELPPDRPYGMNFGISLSLWDYLFGTARIPGDGRDIPLGFPGDARMPRGLVGQLAYPLSARRRLPPPADDAA